VCQSKNILAAGAATGAGIAADAEQPSQCWLKKAGVAILFLGSNLEKKKIKVHLWGFDLFDSKNGTYIITLVYS
jgi:hypothetical protein